MQTDPKRPRAVLFDLDGTLIDSIGDIQRALAVSLPLLGIIPPIDIPNVDQTRTMVGDGARSLVSRATGFAQDHPKFEEALEGYLSAYARDPASAVKFVDGAMELLEALHERGIPAIVCTNKTRRIAAPLIDATMKHLVRGLVAGGDAPMKPDPALLLLALQLVNVDAADVWMVGDSAQDVLPAKQLGMTAIGLLGGYGNAEKLVQSSPDHLIRSLHELNQWL